MVRGEVRSSVPVLPSSSASSSGPSGPMDTNFVLEQRNRFYNERSVIQGGCAGPGTFCETIPVISYGSYAVMKLLGVGDDELSVRSRVHLEHSAGKVFERMTTTTEELVNGLPESLRERVRVVCQRPPQYAGEFVLYWMRTAVRVDENPAPRRCHRIREPAERARLHLPRTFRALSIRIRPASHIYLAGSTRRSIRIRRDESRVCVPLRKTGQP